MVLYPLGLPIKSKRTGKPVSTVGTGLKSAVDVRILEFCQHNT